MVAKMDGRLDDDGKQCERQAGASKQAAPAAAGIHEAASWLASDHQCANLPVNRGKNEGTLNAFGAAVGTRVVRTFQRSIGMQHDSAGMAHGVGIGLPQHVNIVTG